jgi:hypothetical protein
MVSGGGIAYMGTDRKALPPFRFCCASLSVGLARALFDPEGPVQKVFHLLLAQAIDLRFDLRKALWPLAEFGQIVDHLRAAERLAETLQDQRRLAWSLSHLTGGCMMGEHTAAIESGQCALTLASVLKEIVLRPLRLSTWAARIAPSATTIGPSLCSHARSGPSKESSSMRGLTSRPCRR